MNELRWDFADLRETDEALTEDGATAPPKREPALELVTVEDTAAELDTDDPVIAQWIAERQSSGV